jgi:sec-independent protein translocase protein TatC
MESGFLGHVEELRKRIISVLAVFFISLVLGGALSGKFVQIFLSSHLPENVSLVALNPYENIMVFLNVMVFIALAITIPFALYQIIAFIKPGLKSSEARYIVGIPFAALALFLTGAFFGYWLNREIIIPSLTELTFDVGIKNIWSVNYYFKFMIYMSLLFGLVFQLPIVVYSLVKTGILTTGQIGNYRKHIIVFLLVVAGVVTPPDALSMMLMFVPLYALFELSLFFCRFVEK